jgi:tRNA wybutosine-synthesizing protein 3
MGLALESVVGFYLEGESEEVCMVPEWQLKNLIEISNKRFVENTKRIERFRSLLKEMSEDGEEVKMGDAGEWESKESRRARKRAEGLRRAEELRACAGIEDMQKRELEQNL